MKNKVLVQIIVPDVDKNFDVYLPINKKIGNIINLLNNSICEITNGIYSGTNKTALYNRKTGEKYDVDKLLIDTDIRNSTVLVLL